LIQSREICVVALRLNSHLENFGFLVWERKNHRHKHTSAKGIKLYCKKNVELGNAEFRFLSNILRHVDDKEIKTEKSLMWYVNKYSKSFYVVNRRKILFDNRVNFEPKGIRGLTSKDVDRSIANPRSKYQRLTRHVIREVLENERRDTVKKEQGGW
jgi:hypothetical protein